MLLQAIDPVVQQCRLYPPPLLIFRDPRSLWYLLKQSSWEKWCGEYLKPRIMRRSPLLRRCCLGRPRALAGAGLAWPQTLLVLVAGVTPLLGPEACAGAVCAAACGGGAGRVQCALPAGGDAQGADHDVPAPLQGHVPLHSGAAHRHSRRALLQARHLPHQAGKPAPFVVQEHCA